MIRSLALLLGSLALAGCSKPTSGIDVAHRLRADVWDAEVVDSFAKLPVQDGGRVKPLSTVAQFWLLACNGNRDLSVTWADQRRDRLNATEWLLDCFFYPEQAKQYRCIRVDNSEALDLISARIEGRSRQDRYSFVEIAPAADKLFQLANQYRRIEPKKRKPIEGQVVDLAEAVSLLDRVLAFASFTRSTVDVHRTDGLKSAYPGDAKQPLSFVVKNLVPLATMAGYVRDTSTEMDPARRAQEREGLEKLFTEFERGLGGSELLSLFTPAEPAEKTWGDLSSLVGNALGKGQKLAPQHLAMVQRLEEIAAAPADAGKTRAAASALLAAASEVAAARGEYAKVPTEVSFYRGDYFYRALFVFALTFLLAALWWMLPSSRLLWLASHAGALVATALVVTGITYRCIIRGKPPVSTLYETILFITAVGCIVGWIMEVINKQKRVAITLLAFLGALGMFLARRFEELEASDTMPQLVAVLDTNFWLATHVTTVTMGYSAGLFAALIAHVYVFARLAGASKEFTHSVARMIYGVICFGLFFSVVGTILGGIWANDSWGRFWGWDPKENGALLICLSQIAILHGRLAGWLRDQGIAMAAIAGGMIVAFSWWHVNQLGVGLHSYGFTNGILTSLHIFYGSQLLMLGLGLIASTRQPRVATEPAVAATGALASS